MHIAHHFTELRVPEGSVKPNKIPLHTVVLKTKLSPTVTSHFGGSRQKIHSFRKKMFLYSDQN